LQANRRQRVLAVTTAALLAGVTVAAALALVVGSPAPAVAESDFLWAFGANYPAAAGSRISSCLLCHVLVQEQGETEYEMNPYGRDLKESGLNFAAVEGRDSDGDGYANLEEIQALTFPGDPADNPSTVVTTTTAPGGTTTSTAPGSGGALYAANCSGCHGAVGGNLVPTALSRAQLVAVIGSGRGGMPAFSGTLAAAEIGSIADTLLAWSQTTTTQPGTTTTTAAGGTTTTAAGGPSGAAVYAANCSGCHGANGGNLVGRGLSAAQVAAVTTSGRGSMPGFGGTLGAAEINAVGAYVASLGGGGASTTTTTAGGSTTTGAGGPSGAAVYAANCSGCHGANGGNLAGTGLSAAQVAAVTDSGRGSMPGFGGTLSAAEIDAVAAYVAALGGSGATTTTTAAGGSTTTGAPADGAALYAANCAGCHGPAGEGGVGGPIRGTGLGSQAIAAVIRDGAGGMPGFGGMLSAAEIEALVAHTVALAGGDTGSTGATTTSLAGASTTVAAGPVSPGPLEDAAAGRAWWVIALAAALAVAVGSGLGLLLWRSGRRLFGR